MMPLEEIAGQVGKQAAIVRRAEATKAAAVERLTAEQERLTVLKAQLWALIEGKTS